MAFEINLKNKSFYDWFYDELILYIKQMLTSEFKDIFESAPCKVKVQIVDDLDQFFEDYANRSGKYYKIRISDLDRELQIYDDNTVNSMMQARYEMIIENGKMCLTKLSIELSESRLNRYLIHNINNVENFLNCMKQSARHEVGHLIDFISYDGMSLDDYIKMVERRAIEKENWSKDRQPSMSEEDICSYYALEGESVANANVGITPEMCIEADKKAFRSYSDSDIILTIDTK